MTTTYTDNELRTAWKLLPFALLDVSYDKAMATPEFAAMVRSKAAVQRQMWRDLARRAERTQAGRWLESSALDAYEITDRDAHLGEVPA